MGALFTVAATTGTFATAGTAATTVTPAITAGTAATTVTAAGTTITAATTAFTAAVSGGRRLQFRRESRRSSRLRGERRRRGVRGRLAVLEERSARARVLA